MGRLINTSSLTIDGVIDLGHCCAGLPLDRTVSSLGLRRP